MSKVLIATDEAVRAIIAAQAPRPRRLENADDVIRNDGPIELIDGMVEAMGEAVGKRGTPFLGVCVGMQLLADAGEEFGRQINAEMARLGPVFKNLGIR